MSVIHPAGYLFVNEAIRLVSDIFFRCGFPEQAAATIAENLIFADQRGVATHGISRVKSYCDRAKQGLCNRSPSIRVLRETLATLLVDGDNGNGAVVGRQAMLWTIHKARASGAAVCAVQNSSHFGAAAYYTMMAAKEGMIGFAATNGPANMAHYGSSSPMLGTNPFSVAVPANSHSPLLLDIATSVAARGNILNAAREGEAIPLGWALDANGNPTTDAQSALDGCVLPFAGHKGSGMAILIDTLCGILSGSEFGTHVRQSTPQEMQGHKGPGIGHLFIVMDPSGFQPSTLFLQRVDQQIDELKAAKPLPGFDEILVPGELEERRAQNAEQQGIPIAEGTRKDLQALCEEMGIEMIPLHQSL